MAHWDLKTEDLSHQKRTWKVLDERLASLGQEPFKLEEECPARFYLFKVAHETHVFAVVCHHAALDGWSLAQFFEEVSAHYSNLSEDKTPPSLPARLSFQSFVQNPERYGTSDRQQGAALYWEKKFATLPGLFPLSPKESTSLEGARLVFNVEYELYKSAKDLIKELKLTPFIYLISAFYLTLSKRHYTEALSLGVPSGNRELKDADKMMGQCANLLTFLFMLPQNPLPDDVIKIVKQEMVTSFPNLCYPHEELLQKVKAPLFNIVFNIEPTSDLPDFGEVSLFIHPFPIRACEHDLTLNISDLDYFWHCEFDYRTDQLNETEAHKLSQEFLDVLKGMNAYFKGKS